MHAHHFKPSLGVYDEALDDDISLDEVYAVLRHIKSGKVPGKDSLKIEMYKSLPPQFIQLLVKFWNIIMQKGEIPKRWCTGMIIPIPKSGDKLDVNNYRGITLLPVIAKLFFAVLARRLYEWAELHEIIPVEQFGFRSGHRTIIDAIFVLNALIESTIIKRQKCYCCFVDFKKAFDSVHHGLLWHKLSSIGVSSKCLKILIDIYANAQSCIHGKYSEKFLCNIGVRQGCPLSPVLFTLFIHDLLD